MNKKEKKTETKQDSKGLAPHERKQILIEGIKKTMVPAFIAAFFAVIIFERLVDAIDVPWLSVLLLVAIISYYIQKFLYPFIGVRVQEFEKKDWFYVEFMVIIFLLVIWTLLLN